MKCSTVTFSALPLVTSFITIVLFVQVAHVPPEQPTLL